MAQTNGPGAEDKGGGLKLEQVGREVSVPSGTCIVRQGEPPNHFYVIKSGRLRVFRETADGIRTDLTELGPGDYFGEVALVTGQPRTASVEAVEDSHLFQVSKEEFDFVLDNNPQLARHIIQQLAHWLVTGDRRLEREVVREAKLRKVSWFDYALMIGLSIVFALVFNLYNDNQIPLIQTWDKDEVTEISLTEARKLYQENAAIFVDARKNGFYEQRHIREALNLPVVFFDLMYPMFEFMLAQKENPKEQPVIAYGGVISRRFDLELARALKDKGFEKVRVFGGDSYRDWPRVFPVVEGQVKKPGHMPLGVAGLIEWLPVSIFLLILIPPVRRSPYLSAFCRVLLGVIFIQFALSKIMRPAVFALNVVDYGMMPAWGVNLWALILPWAELLVGLFLILGIRTRAAATLIGGMNIIFIVGLVNALYYNLPISCGCVGEAGEPVTWWKVLKNTGMLVMAAQIFFYDRLFVLDRGGFVWRERKI
ncbi:MAG: cyclic nucleotide-binding domain-containing protein [Deltaproteobacteria bacterium]|nr:cyclic nucleotide-binding domain-containing protein [Deltaproteobacteria bacterium]